MSPRTLIIGSLLWLGSLIGVAVTVRAQAPQPAPAPSAQVLPHPDAEVLSGADIGFRVTGWEGGRPVGTIVVRIDGRWVEPGSTKRLLPITR